MAFHEYPYTDFHEMNLDWVIKKVKELAAAWAQVQQDWTDEQAAFANLQSWIENYFNNLNVQTEINVKLDAMVAAGTMSELIAPFVASGLPAVVADQIGAVVASQIGPVVAEQIGAVVADQLPAVAAAAAASEVSAWLAAHVNPETGYVIDDTLTVQGAAADAKAVGDKVTAIKSALNVISDANTDTVVMGNVTGTIGSVIEIASSNNYAYTSCDAVEGIIYKVVHKCRSNKNVYTFFVDENDVVLSTGASYTEADDTIVTEIITAPTGAKKLYAETYSRDTSGLLTVEGFSNFTDLTKKYDNSISDLENSISDLEKSLQDATNDIRAISEVTENILYFTDPDNIVTDDYSIIFNRDGSLTINGTTARSVDLPIMGKSLDEYNVFDGDVISSNRFTTGESTANVSLRIKSTNTGISGTSDVEFESDDTIFVRVGVGTYTNYNVKFMIVRDTVRREYYIPHLSADDYVARKQVVDLQDAVEDMQEVVDHLDEAYLDRIPSYYKDHIAAKSVTVNGLLDNSTDANAGTTPSQVNQFVFFTDYHYDNNGDPTKDNTGNSEPLIEYLLRNTGCVFACHGGDILNGQSVQSVAVSKINDFVEKFYDIRDRLFCCIGNHEYANSNNLSYGQITGLINKNAEWKMKSVDDYGDFYLDNMAQKTRYFFMGCDRRGTGSVMMSVGQLHWLFESLQTVPNGFDCVIFAHRLIQFEFDYDNEEIIPTLSNYGAADGKSVADGCDAYNAKSSYTFDSVTYNFSQAHGKVLCVFTGHSHQDAYVITNGGIPVIMVTTDCCPKRITGYDWTNRTWKYESVAGTAEEQAFDAVTLDKRRRKVYCTRIGYGVDRVFDMPSA